MALLGKPLFVGTVLALLLLGPLGRAPPADAHAAAFRVIVHPKNPLRDLDRAELARIFLKKVTRWPDDTPASPVDLRADAEARREFSESVLGRSIGAVRSYWQQAIFTGRDTPPPELDSDEAVVRFVLAHRGAVGYVSPRAELRGAVVLVVH